MSTQSDSGAISQRTEVFANAQLLQEAKQRLLLNKFAAQYDQPLHKSTTQRFRRYKHFTDGIHPIVDAETPTPSKIDWEEFDMTLQQYGKVVRVPEFMRDTHEDPIVQTMVNELSYDMFLTVETLDYNVYRQGTSALFANGIETGAIKTLVTSDDFTAAVGTLEENNAQPITSLVRSTPDFNTESIAPSFIAYAPTALAATIRGFDDFIPVEKYHNIMPMMGEIGSVGGLVRVVCSTVATKLPTAGAVSGSSVRENADGTAQIFPIMVFAKDAVGTSKLAGKGASEVVLKNPSRDSADPLGLKGYAGYKFWHASVIMNNDYLVRIESAAPSLS